MLRAVSLDAGGEVSGARDAERDHLRDREEGEDGGDDVDAVPEEELADR